MIVALSILVALLGIIFALRQSAASAAPAETRTAAGTIISKTYKPPATYTQEPAGSRGGFKTPTEIPIAEHYTFEIRLDNQPSDLPSPTVRASLNSVLSDQLTVGQKVKVTYMRRRSLFGQHVSVYNVQP